MDIDQKKIPLSLDGVYSLAVAALRGAGAGEVPAASLARAFRFAEADGLPNHGLARLPAFCSHIAVGKIDGKAEPVVSRPLPGVVEVDAGNGLSHPAVDAGLDPVAEAAREVGIAILLIRRAYSCHVLGYHTERLAQRGLLAIGFGNAPASIAPPGGRKGVLGTNPMSFALPRGEETPIVVDQASSVIAKSEITDRARHGEAIPTGWALGPDGEPTTDARAAMQGTMVPFGGYKGFNVALLSEFMSTAVAGGRPAIDTLPFADLSARPMELGQALIAIDFRRLSQDRGDMAVERISDAILGQGGRLPGGRRAANRSRHEREGVEISAALHAEIRGFIGQGEKA